MIIISKYFVLILACLFEHTKCEVGRNYYNMRYMFYRDMDRLSNRRVFGGRPANITEFPYVTALLDKHFASVCTATILRDHWCVTSAHCLQSDIVYVKFNTNLVHKDFGDIAVIRFIFIHPKYSAVYGPNGKTLTELYHDIGLVRTRTPLITKHTMNNNMNYIFNTMHQYNPDSLTDKGASVKAFGFGHTEASENGELLMAADMILLKCSNKMWHPAICCISPDAATAAVCVADSGGPLVYQGVVVGIASLGPEECSTSLPRMNAKSVFIALYYYKDVLKETMEGMDADIASRRTFVTSTSPSFSHVESHTLSLSVFLIALILQFFCY